MPAAHHTPEKMPVLFIGHGSPMNMVLDNRFTHHLAGLGASLPRPAAILVISAHWLTRGSYVACTKKPRMIYDFYGFPEELYEVTYGCPGHRPSQGRPPRSRREPSAATRHGGSTMQHIPSSGTCTRRRISQSSS